MARDRYRVTLEQGLKLDLNRLVRQNVIKPGDHWGGTLRWHYTYSDETIAKGRVEAYMKGLEGFLTVTIGDGFKQTIDLVWTPRHFGGGQWYFRCPKTARKASVIWKPPGARSFASRQAWGRQVAYSSQFSTPHDRALNRAQAMRYKLGGINWVSLIDDFMPPKPKWMRKATYERKIAKLERYERVTTAHLWAVLSRLKGLG